MNWNELEVGGGSAGLAPFIRNCSFRLVRWSHSQGGCGQGVGAKVLPPSQLPPHPLASQHPRPLGYTSRQLTADGSPLRRTSRPWVQAWSSWSSCHYAEQAWALSVFAQLAAVVIRTRLSRAFLQWASECLCAIVADDAAETASDASLPVA